MLQLAVILNQKEEVIKRLITKHFDATPIINEIEKIDEKRRKTQTELDQMLAQSNAISKEIGMLMGQGKKDEAEARKQEVLNSKNRIQELQIQKTQLEEELIALQVKLPNLPSALVPEGKVAADNEIVKSGGPEVILHEGAKPHWDLTTEYNLIDFELGNKITGAGFPVYMGKGAQLQRALISYFLEKANEQGYLEIQPPLLVNSSSGFGTGQLPDKDAQMYHVIEDGFYLIPTAEVPVTNIYRDVTLKEEDFPIKLTGYTPCFRREAGSYGKDVRGLNRLHQFDKVEIVQLSHPEQSYKILDEMVAYVESLVQSLGLKYRILRLCGGDMSFASALTYDFEVYSAAQGRWLEVSSVSNFEAFQSNRMKLKYKDKNGKLQYAHTLNGSALALPRIVAALLETYQRPDGIDIPEVLWKYTGWKRIS
jgi:seryl-tRNA synthetase